MHANRSRPPLPTPAVRPPSQRWRARILGLGPSQADFAVRGFAPCDPAVRERLEGVGRTFLDGYNGALGSRGAGALVRCLADVPPAERGFAVEGAAMAYTLLDLALPPFRPRRILDLLRLEGGHAYMIHVGAGWAFARLRRRMEGWPGRFGTLAGAMVFDGYGFHEGYFRWRGPATGARARRRMDGPAARLVDRGLGRSLWFVAGGTPTRIRGLVDGFVPARRGDLWAGVGLAAAYAGGAPPAVLGELAFLAGPHRGDVAQGAAFAAEARRRARNPAPHTGGACRILCGCGVEEALERVERARHGPGVEPSAAGFVRWAEGTRAALATVQEAA